MSDNKTVAHIAENGQGAFSLNIKAGDHIFTADEPKDVGGDDTGPTPYELLLSSLGACTVMSLRMYANRKQWDVEKIEVLLTHEKIHKSDCENCDKTKNSYIDHIDKVLILTGDLSDEQRQRMKEIAEKCPVNKTLTNPINMETKVA